MQDFMLLFHSPINPDYRPSPEEFQAAVKQWEDWAGGIAAQGKFKGTNALNHDGRVVGADGTVTDGPFTEIKEIINGYALVSAENYDDAVRLTENCPVFAAGGRVEVRSVMDLG